ncbi:hypothetical protein C5167_022701 [Papaver somniferum]|uniref:Vacuolar protein-sorting-associated protein 33 homolog n=1 Tax=Papaver somniferum TaxID=3469 RepID=A0A4Y7JIQ1_PAPSO|nr:hypothetical protein C5167_022701 [Papaver somniferum]
MAQIPNLDNAPLDLTSLREQSHNDLLKILRNIRGNKCLIVDQKLSGSLSLIIQTSILKEHGVELRRLSSEPVQTECTKVVYLIRSQLNLVKLISAHIQNDLSKGIQREYSVYFVPRRTVACEKIFEEEKVHHLLTIGEYPLYMIPLDEDVLSFELDLAYRDYLVDGDTSALWHIAKSIHKLEYSFGVIPNVRAKGKASARISEILTRIQVEEPVSTSDVIYVFHFFVKYLVACLVDVTDKVALHSSFWIESKCYEQSFVASSDMVTPMCVQLTYEGLMDEILRVSNGSVELDASIMGNQLQEGKKTKVPLNSSDKLFKETRDLNFGVVLQVLNQKAKDMRQDYMELHTAKRSFSEINDYVEKLSSFTGHIGLTQHLATFTSKPSFSGKLDMDHAIVDGESYDICFEYIEEMIHKQEPIVNVLRLLVLFSITNSGLPKKKFDYIRREFLHSYGFEHIATLCNLEKAGLLKKQEVKGNWLTIKHGLKLNVEDTDTANPNDIACFFPGYAPLSIRLVQHAVRSGWRPIEEILKLLPGPHSEIKRGGYSSTPSFDTLPGAPASIDKVADGRRSLVLVVFLCSSSSQCSEKEGMAYDLIVGTTKMVNGNTIIETLIETFMETIG